ncbi:MAG: hypothetical protein H9872_07245 [Candidatus Cellulosilyticum pullistercoris]|uniref:Uncharacterized protein n=1 Tax=Candidatus Cellulosilyticum pullistercoris TaxID=2838521 RepID=A0A9E2KCA2_9FIRM|nr:hypothetical protein [Candidatus Cellulosilyticum pullistercoris]
MEKYGITFKEMNKKEKVKHIWEYYRWHILATVIAVVMIFSLGKTILFPEPPDEVDIVIAAQMHINTDYNSVLQQFKEEFKTGLDLMNINWEDAESAFVMLQKIPLMITTDEMDIFGTSSDAYEDFVKIYGEDMFTPLEDIPALSDLLEKYKDNLITCDYVNDENGNKIATENHVYGIRVDKLSNIPCIDANEEIVIGLTSRVKDLDKAIVMLKYILE